MSLSRERRRLTREEIHLDFMEALHRLLAGEPKNKKLKVLSRAKKLKVTAANVALEAGHSRTLIAMDDCQYPAIREAIRLAQDKKSKAPTTYTQLNQNLRAELVRLKEENKQLLQLVSAHLVARKRAENDMRRQEIVMANLRRELAQVHKVTNLTPAVSLGAAIINGGTS